MAASQLLGLESYVAGSPPEFVSVRAEPLSWVVAVHNKLVKKTVVGYFGNPRESKGFEDMRLPIGDDGDLSGLEVRVLCVTPRQKNDTSVTEKIFGQEWLNERYLMATFEGAEIPSQRIKMRYARGSKLVHVNMSTGKLQVRNVFENRKPLEDGWRPPEPDENESYYPPEPNEERFWRLGAAKKGRGQK